MMMSGMMNDVVTEYACNRYNSNPEPRLQKQRDSYAENPQAKLAKNAEYRKANPEKELARQRRWRNNNKEWARSQWRSRSSNRRALLSGNSSYLVTKKDIMKIISKPCTYCGSTENIQVDHIFPIARGGSHSIGNLTSACQHCNASKGKKFLVEWRK
jgi:5-methylcytosine-specific restriction endonuclease McrA